MSTSTQFKDFSDLYSGLVRSVREQTSVTATDTQAKRYINTALQDMHIGFGEKFPWCERKARLTTHPGYSTGTVAITKGATALTGASTLWTTANDFGVNNMRTTGKIVIAGTPVVYEITAVGSATTATLGSRYVGETETAATYVYFEDEYDLDADFLRPLDQSFFDTQRDIPIVDRIRFRRNYVKNATTGKPRVCCFEDRAFVSNTTPVRRVVFHQPPDAAYSIPYSFVTNKLAVSSAGVAQQSLSADADEPIVPFQYRHAIHLNALYHWYRDKKDDTRSKEVREEFFSILTRMTGDVEIGSRKPSLRPAVSGYRQNARSPYRSGTRGHWTTGDRFDRMEDDF